MTQLVTSSEARITWLLQLNAARLAARDGMLTFTMEWLSIRNLVNLPIGIDPFRTIRSHAGHDANSEIEVSIHEASRRIEKDISRTQTLHRNLLELRGLYLIIQETVHNHINFPDDVNKHAIMWQWFLQKSGISNPQNNVMKQHIDRLVSMKPVFDHVTQRLLQRHSKLKSFCTQQLRARTAAQIYIRRRRFVLAGRSSPIG